MKAFNREVRTVALEQIMETMNRMEKIDIIDAIQDGFAAYSRGEVVVPPVGEMLFEEPPGEVHIKYGYINADDYYVIKIASGFNENSKLGISPNSGLMLIFSKKTGRLLSILLDQGHLTNVRTAAAGAVAARFLAPASVYRIGILGTGCQGRMQLEYLKPIVACRDVLVWGRNRQALEDYKKTMTQHGYRIQTTLLVEEVAADCNLIVTTTPAKEALLKGEHIRAGTHITAIGSDTPDKNELAPAILKKADIIVADSIEQSQARGEIFQARLAGVFTDDRIVELGNVIRDKALARASAEQITVADLTGVAIQDIQICKIVSKALEP